MHAGKPTFYPEMWEELVINKGTHHVEDRVGHKIEIIRRLNGSNVPYLAIVTFFDGAETYRCYLPSGRLVATDQDSGSDLFIVPNPPKVIGYANIYNEGAFFVVGQKQLYTSKDDAISCAYEFGAVGYIEITEDMIKPYDSH
jgi:hypothetical protein